MQVASTNSCKESCKAFLQMVVISSTNVFHVCTSWKLCKYLSIILMRVLCGIFFLCISEIPFEVLVETINTWEYLLEDAPAVTCFSLFWYRYFRLIRWSANQHMVTLLSHSRIGLARPQSYLAHPFAPIPVLFLTNIYQACSHPEYSYHMLLCNLQMLFVVLDLNKIFLVSSQNFSAGIWGDCFLSCLQECEE